MQYTFWKFSNPNTPSKFHCKQVFLNLFILLARIGSAVHYANPLGEPTVRQMPKHIADMTGTFLGGFSFPKSLRSEG